MRCVSRLPPLGQALPAPGLAFVLGCPAGYAWLSAWEGDTRRSGLLVAESEPDHDEVPGLPDRQPRVPARRVGAFLHARRGRRRRGRGVGTRTSTAAAGVFGTQGKSSVTVSPPPGVSSSRAVPPLEMASRCTMARPSPVPFGLEVVKRRKARSRSSALMPGPSSRTVIRAPVAVASAVSRTTWPGLSASRALAIRLSRICSRCPSPIQASTGAPGPRGAPRPLPSAARRLGHGQHDAAVVGDRMPGHDPLPGHLGDVHRCRHRHHVLRAGHRQQAVDQPGQPGQLVQRAGQLMAGVRVGVGGEQVQPQPQRSQRGAQLVRHVGDDRPVPVHQRLEPPGHRVERGAQAAQLRRARADLGPDREVAVGEPAGRGVQAFSGLLTQRARPNASSAAAIIATAAIDPRMTHSATISLVQRPGGPGQDHGADHRPLAALAVDRHGRDDLRSRGLGDRLAGRGPSCCELGLLRPPAGRAGSSCRPACPPSSGHLLLSLVSASRPSPASRAAWPRSSRPIACLRASA